MNVDEQCRAGGESIPRRYGVYSRTLQCPKIGSPMRAVDAFTASSRGGPTPSQLDVVP